MVQPHIAILFMVDYIAGNFIATSGSDWRSYGDIAQRAGYRYGLASEIMQGDYKATVLGKINQVLRNDPYNLDSDLTPTELSRCKSWYNNLEFRKLIAALDMFWVKFPESIGAKLRVCTLSSRFKDCSTISEIRHLSDVSGKRWGMYLNTSSAQESGMKS